MAWKLIFQITGSIPFFHDDNTKLTLKASIRPVTFGTTTITLHNLLQQDTKHLPLEHIISTPLHCDWISIGRQQVPPSYPVTSGYYYICFQVFLSSVLYLM